MAIKFLPTNKCLGDRDMTEIARYSLHYITDIHHYKHLSRHLAVGLLISKLLASFNGFNEINAFFEVLIHYRLNNESNSSKACEKKSKATSILSLSCTDDVDLTNLPQMILLHSAVLR